MSRYWKARRVLGRALIQAGLRAALGPRDGYVEVKVNGVDIGQVKRRG